ncbi:uncharacterized protein LOC115776610 [Archocentrus centrarchus]|uniref:uncharacterized protein LOC115776610 n=1 Tax=Archocentrus centrarchus TaxID=63155 RepID=UPI0011EA4440|nr:uncharacterized protein LOC115776610 [Archocentrus centrarchus]
MAPPSGRTKTIRASSCKQPAVTLGDFRLYLKTSPVLILDILLSSGIPASFGYLENFEDSHQQKNEAEMAAGAELQFAATVCSLLSQMDSLEALLCLSLIAASVALQQDVQAKLRENATLQCQIPKHETISVLKWSRADLSTDGYVYFYRNRRSYENYQHPSFHGRVKLRNPEMKDGDVSLILKNVTFNDTGIYECHIAVRNSGSSNRAHSEINHFINLTVTGETHKNMLEQNANEGEHADGNMNDVLEVETTTVVMVLPAAVAAAVVVTVICFVVHRRHSFISCSN